MTKIKQGWGTQIDAACATSSVPAGFVAALVANESGGDPNALRFEPAVFLLLADVLMGKKANYQTHGMKRPLGSADLLGRIEPAGPPRPPLRSALYSLAELATSKGGTQIMGWHAVEFNRSALSASPQDQLDFTLELLAWFAQRYQLDVTREFEPLFHCWNTGTPTDPPATFNPKYVANGLSRKQLYEAL